MLRRAWHAFLALDAIAGMAWTVVWVLGRLPADLPAAVDRAGTIAAWAATAILALVLAGAACLIIPAVRQPPYHPTRPPQ
jgi:hypothetical protein